MIEQTEEFLSMYSKPNDIDIPMTFDVFQQWLNIYPFVRTIIRESFMPRVWSITDG